MIAPSRDRYRKGGPVLVVDDDQDVRDLLQAALEDQGWVVEAAADGAQALQRAHAVPPAMAVLDWNLPDCDGGSLATRLRSEHGQLPVLLMTAELDAAEKAEQMGAQACVPKPFDLERLLEVVQETLPASAVTDAEPPRAPALVGGPGGRTRFGSGASNCGAGRPF